MDKIKLRTSYEGFHEVTKDVQKVIEKSGIKDGFALLHCHHTTASLTITSFWDKRGHIDLMVEMDKIVPTRNDFLHQRDTPTDAAAHVKTSLLGSNLNVIIKNGKLFLGSSQGIFMAEFDGPRNREFYVKCFSDN